MTRKMRAPRVVHWCWASKSSCKHKHLYKQLCGDSGDWNPMKRKSSEQVSCIMCIADMDRMRERGRLYKYDWERGT